MRTVLLVAAAAGFLLLLVLLGRLLLRMEARGWVYYRKRRGTSDRIGAAALHLNSILEPSKRVVVEQKEREAESQEGRDRGAPPE